MKLAVFTAFLSFLIVSVLLGGFGLLFSRNIMVLLNTPADVLDMAVEYLKSGRDTILLTDTAYDRELIELSQEVGEKAGWI